jgi:hypothetical protein
MPMKFASDLEVPPTSANEPFARANGSLAAAQSSQRWLPWQVPKLHAAQLSVPPHPSEPLPHCQPY